MDKKRVVKYLMYLLNFVVIGLLIWSVVSYEVLQKQVTEVVAIYGLIAMVVFVVILEGAPVFVGGSVAVASLLAMGQDPKILLGLFLISAIIGNIFYYYLGYFSGKKILKYFDKKDIKKYEKFFKKYSRVAMWTMAVSPVPYLPTVAGVFKLSKKQMFIETLFVRLIRHSVIFFFWYIVLVL